MTRARFTMMIEPSVGMSAAVSLLLTRKYAWNAADYDECLQKHRNGDIIDN